MTKGQLIHPAGRYGAALLLMRVAASGQLAVTAFFASDADGWLRWGLASLTVLLLIGLWTRAGAVATTLVFACAALRSGGAPGVALATQAFEGVALAFLGPGAYSLDSRLFGRRVLTLQG